MAYDLLVAIGKCHRLLKNHADKLASRSAVKTVTHWSDMPSIDDAFRLEEYVDTELVDGEAVSWCLELTITPEGVRLVADVRRIHSIGQDVLVEVADRQFTNLVDFPKAVIEVTERLCASGPA
jgi:hypothetical protein